MSHLSDSAVLELVENSRNAERLARGSAADRKQADILLSRNSDIRLTGLSSLESRHKYAAALVEQTAAPRIDEARHRKLFVEYLSTGRDEELRDFLAGQQTISWTQGAIGGYTVPITFDSTLRTAMAATDPLLDDSIVDLKINASPFVQPRTLAGYDLSTISAVTIAEAAIQNPVAVPSVAGAPLRSDLTWRISFAASVEFAEDAADGVGAIVKAAGVGLSRGVGRSMVSGRGGADILGITQQLSSSGGNAVSGKIQATDISNFFFSIDAFYRSQPKSSWLVSDGTMKYLRNAVDNSGRPLLDMSTGNLQLMGAPIHNCPSLADAFISLGLTGILLFGDMSHIVARFGAVTLQNVREQAQHGVDIGETMFIARMRGDSTIFDPSNGSNPAIRMFTIN